ncbi:hypothetical protein AMECASPLE_027837 [Ameca splendens]|uniref:Uncharacterized protein n=1 Tax=Ameca splendens TaxID=208324 RepID=A0ABV0XU93_9TELE
MLLLWFTRSFCLLMPTSAKRRGPSTVKGEPADQHCSSKTPRFTLPATLLYNNELISFLALIDSGSDQNLIDRLWSANTRLRPNFSLCHAKSRPWMVVPSIPLLIRPNRSNWCYQVITENSSRSLVFPFQKVLWFSAFHGCRFITRILIGPKSVLNPGLLNASLNIATKFSMRYINAQLELLFYLHCHTCTMITCTDVLLSHPILIYIYSHSLITVHIYLYYIVDMFILFNLYCIAPTTPKQIPCMSKNVHGNKAFLILILIL